MTYLINSDWVADFLGGRVPSIELMRELAPQGIAFSVVSYVEVMEGVRGSRQRPLMEEGFRRFLAGVEVLELTMSVADRAADIRLQLRSNKRQVNHRAMDILIAATAMSHNLSLATRDTRNTRDYADIPGLVLHPVN